MAVYKDSGSIVQATVNHVLSQNLDVIYLSIVFQFILELFKINHLNKSVNYSSLVKHFHVLVSQIRFMLLKF